MRQDARQFQYYEAVLPSIISKLEVWPVPVTFTEQESQALQVKLVEFFEVVKPYPYPYSPLTFSQDTQQLSLVQSILAKVKAGQ